MSLIEAEVTHRRACGEYVTVTLTTAEGDALRVVQRASSAQDMSVGTVWLVDRDSIPGAPDMVARRPVIAPSLTASVAPRRAQAIAWPCPLAVVDLETTGLDLDDDITELAVIRLDCELREVARCHLRVCAAREQASAGEWVRAHTAWGRAGSAQDWSSAGAVALHTAIDRAWPLIEGAALVAHHLPFDLPRLGLACRRRQTPAQRALYEHLHSELVERCSVDTRQLASPLAARGLSRSGDGAHASRSLGAVCAALGVSLSSAHDALCDAEATAEVLRRLLAGAGGSPP